MMRYFRVSPPRPKSKVRRWLERHSVDAGTLKTR
jgi:hypothetical protein